MEYFVIRDSREKPGFGFQFDGRTRGCLGTKIGTLKTGDYTVAGLEDLLMIERKESMSELAQCLFQDRFKDEMLRMRGCPFAYVINEFPFSHLVDYPRIPTVPHAVRKRVKVSGSLLLKTLLEYEQLYPWVKFHFAGENGRNLAGSLFKRAVEYAATIGRVPLTAFPAG